MIRFLAGIFIKDNENVNDANVRRQYGILCGAFGIVLNLFLCIIKTIAAFMADSVSILADAANNMSDAASSVVTIIGFKLAGHKPDKEHPFGHGRIEYVAGLVVAFIIFGMAVELFRNSIKKIIHPEKTEFSITIACILIVSIVVKLYMFYYNRRLGQKLSSAVLTNNSKDSISDVLSTSVVLISSIIGYVFDIRLDGYAGSLVSLFIFYQAFEAAKDTISPLLGEAPSHEMIRNIKNDVLSFDSILGVHDIVIHNYGPNKIMMSLHAEVSSDGTLIEVHDLVDSIERFLNQKYLCTATIHVDPVNLKDEQVKKMKEELAEHLQKVLGKDVLFHDFRVVHHKNERRLEFDLVVPFDYKSSDDVILELVYKDCDRMFPDYKCDVTIDKAEIIDES